MNDHITYIYHLVTHDGPINKAKIDEISAEGWELVTVHESRLGDVSIWRRRAFSAAVQKIRDYVEALYNRHQGKPGCRTGEDACSNILHFIDTEILS